MSVTPRLACLLCLCALLSPARAEDSPSAQPVLGLSRGEALEQALGRNFLLRQSRLDQGLAEEAVRAARGAFDPVLTAEYQYRNTDYKAFATDGEQATLDLGVNGRLPAGTRYALDLSNGDATYPFTVEDRNTLLEVSGDQVSTAVSFAVAQPLVRGFRANEPLSQWVVARRRQDQSDAAFLGAVMDVVTSTVQAYHALYFADRSLAIAERNQANAAQLLRDNRKRVEAGAMAPLDIYQAESEVAVRESATILARRERRLAENRLKRLIFGSPESLHRRLEVDPLPAPEPVAVDPARDYPVALEARPDYEQALLEREISEIEVDRARWAARPQVDLVASFGRYAAGRDLHDSYEGLRDPATEHYAVGLVVSHPLFNRTRKAEHAAALLLRNQTVVLQEDLEQRIMLELDDAAAGLQAAWERVETTRRARELAERSLEAEEKKLRIGTSSTFVVLRLQGDLTNAEIRELAAVVDYYDAVAGYEYARGTTLAAFGIQAR